MQTKTCESKFPLNDDDDDGDFRCEGVEAKIYLLWPRLPVSTKGRRLFASTYLVLSVHSVPNQQWAHPPCHQRWQQSNQGTEPVRRRTREASKVQTIFNQMAGITGEKSTSVTITYWCSILLGRRTTVNQQQRADWMIFQVQRILKRFHFARMHFRWAAE